MSRTESSRPAAGTAADVTIEHYQAVDHSLCDQVQRFLAGGPAGACGDHDPRWVTVFQQALAHDPHVLVARDRGGGICGYLPLCLVAGRLFGRFLVSLPYLNRGGVAADDPEVADKLIGRAMKLADQLDVDHLELRHLQPVAHSGFNAVREDKVLMTCPLPTDADALWQQMRSKVRNHIRTGDRHRLTIQFGHMALLDDFYHVFAINMRDLGTPVYGKDLFACMVQQLADTMELVVVRMDRRPIAGAVLVHRPAMGRLPASTQVPSASSLRRFNRTNCNMWMYHRLLLRAIERGSRVFDFGRSTVGSGTWQFKKQWGAKAQPLHWQQVIRRGDAHVVRPDDPRYRLRIAVWQRLPVWLTRRIGPGIVRGVP